LYGNTREMIVENNQIIAVYFKPIYSVMYDTLCYVAQNSDIAKKDPMTYAWTSEIDSIIVSEGLTIDL